MLWLIYLACRHPAPPPPPVDPAAALATYEAEVERICAEAERDLRRAGEITRCTAQPSDRWAELVAESMKWWDQSRHDIDREREEITPDPTMRCEEVTHDGPDEAELGRLEAMATAASEAAAARDAWQTDGDEASRAAYVEHLEALHAACMAWPVG